MSDPSFDHEIHDYTPVNKYIEEQARIRRTRSIWAYTRSIALFLLALGIFLLLLAFAYRWINKPYPEETNHTINYVPAVPENIYPGESSQQPDVFPGSKSETDKEGIGGNEVIVDQSVTYFTTKTIGKYSVVTGFTYNSSEGMRSGNKHNSLTKLLYPSSVSVSKFTFYNSINEQSPIKLNAEVTLPTEKDYIKGSYQRYFAKQANDKNQPSFEISKEDNSQSPLYNYAQLTWYILGDKRNVYRNNLIEINRASRTMPSIRKILSPFQFYRYVEDLSSAEDRRNALLAMLELMKANFADFLANYSTTTQGGGTNTGAGSPGSCSLGSQYTTKEACEAAGGTWTDGIPAISLDADGNYLGNDGTQTDTDAGGNIIEAPEQC